MAEAKSKEYVGFRTSETRKEELRQRAEREGRSMSNWLNHHLPELFRIDDRRRNARRTLTSHT